MVPSARTGVDEPIVWYEGPDLSDKRWLHGDERGSIIAHSAASGAAVTYAYSSYGEPSAWSGSRFRYTGQIMLPEVHLYHYKARVYDPVIGRFLQTDPIGYDDDFNLYSYVGTDPLDRTDPSGLCGFCILGELPPVVEPLLRFGEITEGEQVIGPRGTPLRPLEEIPQGSRGGPGAGKDFPRTSKPENPPPCQYCGQKTDRKSGPDQHNNDHNIPKKQGGNNEEVNRVDSCRTCNLSKGGRTPSEWYNSLKNAVKGLFGVQPSTPPPPPPPPPPTPLCSPGELCA